MYQALYRKYRPVDFDSVVGQDSIIKTLQNSIINNNFSHAYMFFGPRGTGKTTVSKIFARNINCLSSKNGKACRECDNCLNSFSKECIDIIEIDAASNNGVDEIRDLKNKISLVPSELKYKVYIVDEVHMLSIGAFNALLKTLEEPPEHVVFILATTDPQKVPETIISRCQCFNFKKISVEIMKKRLEYVCKNEKIAIDDDVLYQISLFSDGGLRDALGLLDKLVSYTDQKITISDFQEINGIVSENDLYLLLNSILLGNIAEFLEKIAFFDNSGKNLIQIMIQLLEYSRKILVDYYLYNKSFDLSLDSLQDLANLLNEKMFDIKKASNVRIYIEMLFLRFINSKNNSKNNQLSSENQTIINESDEDSDDEFDFNNEYGQSDEFENVDSSLNNAVEKRFVKETIKSCDEESEVEKKEPIIINIKDIMDARVNNTLAKANKNLLNEEISKFELLKDYTFDQEFGYLICSLLDSTVRAVSPDNIIISFDYDSNVEQNLIIIHKLTSLYNKITKSNKNIAIISDKEWDKIKNQYIIDLKNGKKYSVIEEPDEVFEDLNKNDIITSKAVDLFGDIVEFE